ncbi:MAG TPA: tetratricopeptide repeat protein [Ktedonobacteraceae bacterium]
MPTTQPIEVFCSYAYKDEELLRELKAHLSSLQRQKLVSLWYDRRLVAGKDWRHELDEHMNSARLILLLISSDFLASDYCYGIEMQRALERHDAGEARVVPILLRPVDWQDESIARLQALPSGAQPITRWSDRDEALTDVAKGLRKVIAELAAPAASAPAAPMPPIWNVPFARNSCFSARQELLTHLSTELQSNQRAAIGQVQAISGLGGIGKTQLALEYAYSSKLAYRAILWARADNVESLNASYSEIAVLLDLPEKDSDLQDLIVQAVKDWLQKHRAWLLILDNADQPEVLVPFLPPVVGGHVLITTRATVLSGLDLAIAQPLALATFSREQGADFLLQRTGLLEHASEHERAMARAISEEAGGLPLALDQAGAYIEVTATSLDTYMELFQQRRAELLARRNSRSHPDPVATTWSLSIQSVEATNPAAVEILRFCAFLAPDAIPEEIFSKGAQQLGSILALTAADTYLFNEAIGALRAYSLINRDPRERALSVHRLVQFVVRASLSASTRKQWERRAVLALHAAFPQGDFENWSACERLLPHTLLYASWTGQTLDTSLRAASLHFRAGYYLTERGRYAEAEQLLQQALTMREQLVSPEHPDVAVSLNSLGALYVKQGKHAQAEPLFSRALAIAEKVHGPGHPAVATSLNNLATVYIEQRKYTDAELLYANALSISIQQFGPDNPLTLRYLNNLATFYLERKQWDKAEFLLQRSLTISEQLDADNLQNAAILSNLGYLYTNQGKYAEAEALFLRALALEEKYLGYEHVSTAETLFNLAYLYIQQEKYVEAEAFLLHALSIFERVQGKEHPNTQAARQYYAQLQQKTREVQPGKEKL